MKKVVFFWAVLWVAAVFGLTSCTPSPAGGTAATEKPPVARKEAKAAPALKVAVKEEKPKPRDLYEMEVKPLTPVECARCHYGIYQTLREHGGKHRQVCTNCHKRFHEYNPIKKNWKEIMPKCQRCHGEPHGKKAAACLSCHRNPHSPRTIRLADVSGKCALCHGKESGVLQTHTSAHQEVGCEGCHSERHGRVPNCFECHEEGHIPGQKVEECLSCHNPHMPLDIKSFKGLMVSNQVCGSCHQQEFDFLSTTTAKHGKLACTFCHPRHGFKPQCQGCHGKPHSEVLHKKFPNCLKCHLDPHSLRKPKTAGVSSIKAK